MLKPIKGYCPIENKEKTLMIGYIETQTLNHPECIKRSHNCENKNCDKFNNCPIFLKADGSFKIIQNKINS